MMLSEITQTHCGRAALSRQPPHTPLTASTRLRSAQAQHRSQTNPPASRHSTKWRLRARLDQAAVQCSGPSLPSQLSLTPGPVLHTMLQVNTFNIKLNNALKPHLLINHVILWKLCECGGCVLFMCGSPGERGIEPESCIGQSLVELLKQCGISGRDRAVCHTPEPGTMLGHPREAGL